MDDLTDEVWLPIPFEGYGDYYRISSHGRLLSVRSGKILRQYPISQGRLTRTISVNGKQKLLVIHSVVAAAFLGPRPEGMEVRHMDGNCQNNYATNLRYGTHAENMQDRLRHGTDPHASQTHCRKKHEYTPENTYITSRGTRLCRTCTLDRQRANPPDPEKRKAYMREYYQRNKERWEGYKDKKQSA